MKAIYPDYTAVLGRNGFVPILAGRTSREFVDKMAKFWQLLHQIFWPKQTKIPLIFGDSRRRAIIRSQPSENCVGEELENDIAAAVLCRRKSCAMSALQSRKRSSTIFGLNEICPFIARVPFKLRSGRRESCSPPTTRLIYEFKKFAAECNLNLARLSDGTCR